MADKTNITNTAANGFRLEPKQALSYDEYWLLLAGPFFLVAFVVLLVVVLSLFIKGMRPWRLFKSPLWVDYSFRKQRFRGARPSTFRPVPFESWRMQTVPEQMQDEGFQHILERATTEDLEKVVHSSLKQLRKRYKSLYNSDDGKDKKEDTEAKRVIDLLQHVTGPQSRAFREQFVAAAKDHIDTSKLLSKSARVSLIDQTDATGEETRSDFPCVLRCSIGDGVIDGDEPISLFIDMMPESKYFYDAQIYRWWTDAQILRPGSRAPSPGSHPTRAAADEVLQSLQADMFVTRCALWALRRLHETSLTEGVRRALLDWAPERMPKGVEKTTWMSFLNGKSFGNRRMIWTEPSATLPDNEKATIKLVLEIPEIDSAPRADERACLESLLQLEYAKACRRWLGPDYFDVHGKYFRDVNRSWWSRIKHCILGFRTDAIHVDESSTMPVKQGDRMASMENRQSLVRVRAAISTQEPATYPRDGQNIRASSYVVVAMVTIQLRADWYMYLQRMQTERDAREGKFFRKVMDIRFDPVEETEAPEDLNALPRGFTRGEFQSRVTNIVHKLIPETRGQPLRVTPYPDQRACPKAARLLAFFPGQAPKRTDTLWHHSKRKENTIVVRVEWLSSNPYAGQHRGMMDSLKDTIMGPEKTQSVVWAVDREARRQAAHWANTHAFDAKINRQGSMLVTLRGSGTSHTQALQYKSIAAMVWCFEPVNDGSERELVYTIGEYPTAPPGEKWGIVGGTVVGFRWLSVFFCILVATFIFWQKGVIDGITTGAQPGELCTDPAFNGYKCFAVYKQGDGIFGEPINPPIFITCETDELKKVDTNETITYSSAWCFYTNTISLTVLLEAAGVGWAVFKILYLIIREGLFLILPEAKESKLYMALVFYPFAALAMMILCVVFAIATYVPGYTASAADMLLVVCLGYLVAADAGKFVAKSQMLLLEANAFAFSSDKRDSDHKFKRLRKPYAVQTFSMQRMENEPTIVAPDAPWQHEWMAERVEPDHDRYEIRDDVDASDNGNTHANATSH